MSVLFREDAMRKMTSAEDLDNYLKITNPASWTVLVAIAVLLAAGIIWGACGTVPVTTNATGVVRDGQIECFLPLDADMHATTESKVTVVNYPSSIVSVDTTPYSKREVEESIGRDYASTSLSLTDWSYKVIVALPAEMSGLVDGDEVPVQIVMKEIAPLAALFGGV